MKKQQLIIIFVTLAALTIGFSVSSLYYKDAKKQEQQQVMIDNSAVFERSHSPTRGKKNAKVTLVEFLDPECESCRMFYPYVKKIMRENPGTVRLVIRYVPFHKNSGFAIHVLEASRKQGKFWETLEKLFEMQPEWGAHHNPQPQKIWGYLPALGLDIDKLKQDMKDPAIKALIEQDMRDAQALQVRATPTFFANGEQLARFSFPDLVELIERKKNE